MIKTECNNTIVLQFDNTGLILRAKKNLNFINRSTHAPFGHIQTEVCLMRSHVLPGMLGLHQWDCCTLLGMPMHSNQLLMRWACFERVPLILKPVRQHQVKVHNVSSQIYQAVEQHHLSHQFCKRGSADINHPFWVKYEKLARSPSDSYLFVAPIT